MYETIIFERNDGFCTITLNRPHRLNALSPQLVSEFEQALDEIEADDALRAFVITGGARLDGRPCFSAGMDLKEVADERSGYMKSYFTVLDTVEGMLNPIELPVCRLMRRIEACNKPSIAAIDGVCTAGGLEMALACDFRIVSETAKISDLHLKNMGHIGGAGAAARLAYLVGVSAAKMMMITCDEIDGREAWRIGFANQVRPPQELLRAAKELATKIATRNSASVRITKAAINAARQMPYEECLRFSSLCHRTMMDATSGFEGAKAFSEGRQPDFGRGG